MKTIIENLALCDDCTQAAVNNDYTGIDYHYEPFEAKTRMLLIEQGLKRLSSGLVWDSSKNEDEFSTRFCDCCRTPLAGKRNYFCILGNNDD